ncbi:MAG: alpha/beta fold hydrolase [Gammaproteobacteria bacterium]|nr:alpha/beta fold hydrolase [Gammaproteobacteria bacterium]
MPELTRPDTTIHFREAGSGPAILITHGYSATSYMWRDTLDALAADYHAIAWDIRGHGGSDSPDDPALYSRDSSLDDMDALLDYAGADDAILMGHSLGGYLSLAYAVTRPQRVRALVLVGTGPGYRKAEARDGWNKQAEGRARYFEKHGVDDLDSPAAHGGEHTSAAGLARAARGILAQDDALVMDHLKEIAVPALVVVGADDTPFRGASDYLASRLPDARLVVLEGAGHLTNLDAPAAFDEALQAFLKELDGKG